MSALQKRLAEIFRDPRLNFDIAPLVECNRAELMEAIQSADANEITDVMGILIYFADQYEVLLQELADNR